MCNSAYGGTRWSDPPQTDRPFGNGQVGHPAGGHEQCSAELKRLVPGGHIRLQFTDPGGLDSAARTLGHAMRADGSLTLRVPSDGSVSSLRAVFDRLDAESIAVAGLTVHTPDLDDVFLALTGRGSGTTQERSAR